MPDSATAAHPAEVAVLDVDGTLVDTNYQHALAWYRAFRRYDLTIPVWQLHRGIGMGGDKFVPHVAGDRVEGEHGDDLRAAWTEEFDAALDEIAPFADAVPLIEEVSRRGFKIVLASSGKKHHVEHFLGQLGCEELVDPWTTSDDVEDSKPEPDLVAVAIEKVGGGAAVMLGDSPYDVMAAGRCNVPVLAVLTGGFARCELEESGAAAVFESLAELHGRLDETPLRAPGG